MDHLQRRPLCLLFFVVLVFLSVLYALGMPLRPSSCDKKSVDELCLNGGECVLGGKVKKRERKNDRTDIVLSDVRLFKDGERYDA